MNRLMAVVIRLRWPIVALFIVVTAVFALQLPRAEMDTEMKNQLPRDLPTRLNLDRIEEIFGGTDMAMIVLSADSIVAPGVLTRLQKLSAGMESLEHCQRVVGPFTAKDLQGDSLGLTVEPAISLPDCTIKHSDTVVVTEAGGHSLTPWDAFADGRLPGS